MLSKFYNHALVVVLAALVGVAVVNKAHETYVDLRRVTGEIGRQLTRSGYGILSTGEAPNRAHPARPIQPRAADTVAPLPALVLMIAPVLNSV